LRRRAFIQTTGALLGGVAGYVLKTPLASRMRFPLLEGTRPGSPSDEEVRRRLSSLFASPQSAALLGAHFLRTQGQRTGRDQLLADTGINCTASVAERAALRAAFAEARRTDFEAGRVVLVDGWVLARCEVACCALLAGTPGSG
jgi:hypothetical protein